MANAPAKQRNVLIDFMKLVFSIWVFWAHSAYCFFGMFDPGADSVTMALGETFMRNGPGLFGLAGYTTLAFFTFTTGYWFMNYFKKVQRSGVMGRGKDISLAFKYWGKQYSAYAPYLFYGTIIAIVITFAFAPKMFLSDPKALLDQLILAIPEATGFWQFFTNTGGAWANGTYSIPIATEGFTTLGEQLILWNGITWYMSNIICFGVVFFAIFMKSEVIGATVLCPLFYAFWNYTGASENFYGHMAQLGVPVDVVRLWGPACLGILGWYMADYLRKNVNTAKGKKILTVVAVVDALLMVWWVVTGIGGMMGMEILNAIFLTIVFAEKDYYTTGLNKLLNKVPGMKYTNQIALALFLHHLPVQQYLAWAKAEGIAPEWFMNATVNEVYGYGAIFFMLTGIPFIFIDKYFLQKLGKWIAKSTKCNEPVVIEEPSSVEAR